MESRTDVDVIVIGGGVNGTGVARDCALRGFSVALFEKNDIGFGASGNSSGMIHGGPRYLTKNPEVTYTSCLDSGHIQKVAPHLLFRVPFLVPAWERGLRGAAELATYDAFFAVYDKYQSLKRGKTHLRFSAEEVRRLEPGLIATAGAVTFDEWGVDGVRLCVENLKDAVLRGARAFNHCAVTAIEQGGGRVRAVRYLDTETRQTGRMTARFVVNATGAWAPLTAALGRVERAHVRLRPGKGIHVFLERRLSNFAIITKAVDGRQVFLLPWQNMSVLGTTDDDYYGDLDDVTATADEVRYLREAIARVVPAVRGARAIGTWGGVRPTLFAWGRPEDTLSREHTIVHHDKHGGFGFFSMLGGKLASYRLFAQEMTDELARLAEVKTACQTHTLPLPGGEEPTGGVEALALAHEFGLTPLAAKRLCYRHGANARKMLAEARRVPSVTRVVCDCEPVLDVEVRHSIQQEWARSVDDISRRTRLGLGPCGGMRCALECGRILAEERSLSPEQGRDSAARFLRSAFRKRLVAMGPEQAVAESLSVAHMAAQAGIDLTEADGLPAQLALHETRTRGGGEA